MKCWGPYGPWWLLGDRIKSVRGRRERDRQRERERQRKRESDRQTERQTDNERINGNVFIMQRR